jgi:hypothetical protein
MQIISLLLLIVIGKAYYDQLSFSDNSHSFQQRILEYHIGEADIVRKMEVV